TRFSRDWSSDVCSSDLPRGSSPRTHRRFAPRLLLWPCRASPRVVSLASLLPPGLLLFLLVFVLVFLLVLFVLILFFVFFLVLVFLFLVFLFFVFFFLVLFFVLFLVLFFVFPFVFFLVFVLLELLILVELAHGEDVDHLGPLAALNRLDLNGAGQLQADQRLQVEVHNRVGDFQPTGL